MPSPIRGWAAACTDQALSRPVPDDAGAFAARKGTLRMAWRTARRRLQLRLSGQQPMRRQHFDARWRRILWIHEGMPQIGDALMDLAPRSLLTERGIVVDLYAPRHIAELFEDDAWFTQSLHRPQDVQADRYDAAIVLSDARKALALKRERLADLPWVSLQGDYDGPDFHRARFATQRLGDLLGARLNDADLLRHSRQKLQRVGVGKLPPVCEAARLARVEFGSKRVAIAVGGVHAERSYRHWPDVVNGLHAAGVHSFVLVGSANGQPAAAEIAARLPLGCALQDFVGRLDLHGTQARVAGCAGVLCTDGGLLHLALTTRTPILALFNAAVDPAWRLPVDFDGVALRAGSVDVSGISPQQVIAAALRLDGLSTD